jgi:hypothetical protein
MPDGKHPPDVVDELVLSWLSVAGKENSFARNRRRAILGKVGKIRKYLFYPVVQEKECLA